MAVPDHLLVAISVVLAAGAVPVMSKASPQIWMGLGLVLPWTSRLLTTHGAPRFIDFLDFPIVALALIVAALDHAERRGRLPMSHRRFLQWLAVVALVMGGSAAVNDHAEPLRLVAALLISLEPFLLIGAYLLAPPTARQRTWLLRVIALIVVVDALTAIGQKLTVGRHDNDAVKGLLLGAGAGHHVQAGAVAFAFFVMVQAYRRMPVSLAFGAAALVVTSIADNKQVQYVVPLALLVFVFAPKPLGRQGRGVVVLALLMALVLGIAIKTSSVTGSAATYVRVTRQKHAGKPAAVKALLHDMGAEPTALPLGFGPGETVSRFAFLTTPGLLKSGSPVSLLHLHQAKAAQRYQDIALAGIRESVGISSFEQAQSSVIGIFGDYGVLGVLAYAGLIIVLLQALWRRGHLSHLASAALAGWAMVLPLAVVFDWLEEPPFTLMLATVTGLALTEVVKAVGARSPRSSDAVDLAEPAASAEPVAAFPGGSGSGR
jgi:hypothetical protein